MITGHVDFLSELVTETTGAMVIPSPDPRRILRPDFPEFEIAAFGRTSSELVSRFHPIVGSVAVLVVDSFVRFEEATKCLLHLETMLQDDFGN